jgi:hypothetical protein
MDTALKTALDTAVGGFATDALGQITDVLPVALPIVVSVAGLFLAIRLFRAIAHV